MGLCIAGSVFRDYCGWTPFPRHLWQRNYYEHIIRNRRELRASRRYIRDNPRRWRKNRELSG